ncbi:MAG TPA: SDR family oxidoreductase [Anaeromyxobacteraceae bacterium]|nr:SDR family oxidoreductase [Anaeromyxobacteraceae bacterium]
MAANAILFTGFPGFLGSELLPRVLARPEDRRAVCLVQGKYLGTARKRLREIAERHPGLDRRVELVEGDITGAGLGTSHSVALREDVVEVYHLAAAYDLGVPRDLAEKVNVEGTRNVLDFAEGCPHLDAVHYVSTCYVSGRHPGLFTEADLDKGQTFKNHYEETKFRAEVLVQERMRRGMPVAIYRPSIVVGDSATGATQKYDGIYFFIRLILRQPRVAFVPVVGDPDDVRYNFVPRDYVVRAIAHLSGQPSARGRVFQLADPDPSTLGEVIHGIGRAAGRRVVRVPVPLGLARAVMDYVPFVERFLGVPSAGLDYYVISCAYGTDNTSAQLRGTGIELPRLMDYLPRLVDYVHAHPDVPSAAMV